MHFAEIKEILDNCYEVIHDIEAIINNIEIYQPKEFEEYNKYYNKE